MQTEITERLWPGIQPRFLGNRCWKGASQCEWADDFMGLGNNKVQFVGHGIELAIDGFPVLAKGFDRELEKVMVYWLSNPK